MSGTIGRYAERQVDDARPVARTQGGARCHWIVSWVVLGMVLYATRYALG